MSAPQGGRPVLSTANRRGKHLQDKQRAHYLWEQWQCRRQHTTLQLEYTRNASFQNNKTSQCYLGKKWLLYFQLIREIVFLFLSKSQCFVLEENSWRIFVKKTKGPRSLGLGMDHRYYGITNRSDASFSTVVNKNISEYENTFVIWCAEVGRSHCCHCFDFQIRSRLYWRSWEGR